jgi:fumarate reductase flavoprotein subunit
MASSEALRPSASSQVERHQFDVVVIGAGGAGLRAAIALAQADPKLRIALVSKVYPMRSHTCAAEGGAAGVIKPDDSLEHHFNDTVGGGDWLSDQDAVDYFIREAPKELIQLEHWGCPWSREPDGSVAVRPFGGMKKQRTWFKTQLPPHQPVEAASARLDQLFAPPI